MSAVSEQEAMKIFERESSLLFSENEQAAISVRTSNISRMEKLFKKGGITKEAMDHFIFWVKSVKMIKLFLRYGGDIHKIGPPLHPHPITLMLENTAFLLNLAVDSIERRDMVKLIEFLIQEGADVNAVDELGTTSFWNCARNCEMGLCNLLVERGWSNEKMARLLSTPLLNMEMLIYFDIWSKIAV
jgi:hypothetical protein